MAKKQATQNDDAGGSRFILDLGDVELTDEEVEAVQNQITRAALDVARKQAGTGVKRKEPYVKIVFVKAGHVKTIKK